MWSGALPILDGGGVAQKRGEWSPLLLWCLFIEVRFDVVRVYQ